MNNDLTHLIQQVLVRTPPYVWGVLVLVSMSGLLQLRPRRLSRMRLSAMPVAFGALSLYGTISAFGLNLEVLALWATGVALVVSAGQWLGAPPQVQGDAEGRLIVGGSVWPLLGTWAIFATRYVTTVVLVMHPAWREGTLFALAMPLVYGALSGIFTSRMVAILRHAPSGTSALRLA